MNEAAKQTLRTLLDDLRDAQRYVTDWNLAQEEAPKLAARLNEASRHTGLIGMRTYEDPPIVAAWLGLGLVTKRCAENVLAGLELVVISPTILGGYLAGAVAEIDALLNRVEIVEPNE